MRSGTASDNRGGEDTRPSTNEAIERHLLEALDAAETSDSRFHLRQALQLMEALE